MKKLLGIVVLGMLLSNNAYANNLSGKKIVCSNQNINTMGGEYYEFINNDEVNYYFILRKDLKVTMKKLTYKLYPDSIEIHWGIKLFDISRKTLKTSNGEVCKIIKFDIKNHLNKKSEQYLKEASKDNKI